MDTHSNTRYGLNGVREHGLLVAVDVGSARVACAVAELGHDVPLILAAESATSFGIRAGEIVDMRRASEAISIAIQSAADRAEAEVKTVVVGLSGDVKLSLSKAAMELKSESRTVMAADIAQLSRGMLPETGPGRRVVHRFDGPYSVGDLHGVDHPVGLSGDKLEMQAAFLSAAADRLDNLLRAVRGANVEVETAALEPMSCSLGALSPDERALGAAVLDFGAGAFRGALWEGGRLRQIHIPSREPLQSQSGRMVLASSLGGMEGVVLAVARRFRIAPATAERLLRTHGAIGVNEAAMLPMHADVAAVDGLGSVRIETMELSKTLEELLTPAARSLREGLSGFSSGHAVGVVLTGGGARIKGLPEWISKRFGGAPVRIGLPRWKVADIAQVPAELMGPSGCSLSGLVSFGALGRSNIRPRRATVLLGKLGETVRKFAASL